MANGAVRWPRPVPGRIGAVSAVSALALATLHRCRHGESWTELTHRSSERVSAGSPSTTAGCYAVVLVVAELTLHRVSDAGRARGRWIGRVRRRAGSMGSKPDPTAVDPRLVDDASPPRLSARSTAGRRHVQSARTGPRRDLCPCEGFVRPSTTTSPRLLGPEVPALVPGRDPEGRGRRPEPQAQAGRTRRRRRRRRGPALGNHGE